MFLADQKQLMLKEVNKSFFGTTSVCSCNTSIHHRPSSVWGFLDFWWTKSKPLNTSNCFWNKWYCLLNRLMSWRHTILTSPSLIWKACKLVYGWWTQCQGWCQSKCHSPKCRLSRQYFTFHVQKEEMFKVYDLFILKRIFPWSLPVGIFVLWASSPRHVLRLRGAELWGADLLVVGM